MYYRKQVLKNGLRAIVVPMKNTEAVTLLVLMNVGSRDENKDINGISHFLEHLFFKGTKSRPTPRQISIELDKIGAVFNAFTTKESTGFWVKTAANDFDIGIDIVSDILLEPIFKKEEIEKERGVIFQERDMREDIPYAKAADVLENLLYDDTPMGWDIIGTSESIKKINREDILKYFENHYVGSSAVVVVAGNIDEKIAFQKLEKFFRKMPKGEFFPKPKAGDFQKEPQIKLIEKKTDQMHFAMAFRSYNLFDPRKYALDLFSILLGGNFSSRLWMEIREKLGLAYYVSASEEQYTDVGYLAIKAGVSHDSLEKILKKIVEIMKKLKEKEVSVSELKNAKNFIHGRLALGLESSDEVAMFYGEQELLLKKIIQPEEIIKKIEKVSKNDIIEIGKDIFSPEKINLVAIGQHKNLSDKEKKYREIFNKI